MATTVTPDAIVLPPRFPAFPKIGRADAVMADISAALGHTYGAVVVGGTWVVGDRGVNGMGWTPIYGGHGQPHGGDFREALATAFGRKVR